MKFEIKDLQKLAEKMNGRFSIKNDSHCDIYCFGDIKWAILNKNNEFSIDDLFGVIAVFVEKKIKSEELPK